MIRKIDDDPPDAEKEDPFLEAEVDLAMEPYKGLLPTEMFTFFRETLSDTLTTRSPRASKRTERTPPWCSRNGASSPPPAASNTWTSASLHAHASAPPSGE